MKYAKNKLLEISLNNFIEKKYINLVDQIWKKTKKLKDISYFLKNNIILTKYILPKISTKININWKDAFLFYISHIQILRIIAFFWIELNNLNFHCQIHPIFSFEISNYYIIYVVWRMKGFYLLNVFCYFLYLRVNLFFFLFLVHVKCIFCI